MHFALHFYLPAGTKEYLEEI